LSSVPVRTSPSLGIGSSDGSSNPGSATGGRSPSGSDAVGVEVAGVVAGLVAGGSSLDSPEPLASPVDSTVAVPALGAEVDSVTPSLGEQALATTSAQAISERPVVRRIRRCYGGPRRNRGHPGHMPDSAP
jgi:hypothetical protein